MKRINIYLGTLLISLLFLNCDTEIINLEARDELPGSLVATDPQGIEATLSQAYEAIKNIYQSPNISLYKQCGTDIVISGTHMVDVPATAMRGMMEYGAGFSAESGEVASIWDRFYSAVARCNIVVQSIDELEEPTDVQLDYKGQALALRSYLYLELVRRWDNILISEIAPEGVAITEGSVAPKEEVYNLILADCQEAASILRTRAENGSVGIPSKGLANILLAEAALDVGNWQLAANAADAAIADASYVLQPLDAIFGLNGGKEGEENNQELVFSIIFDPSIIDVVHFTAQHYVPLYDRVNGVARTMVQGGRPWSRFSPSEYYWSLFEDGDGRLQAWHKLEWIFDDVDNLPEGKSLGDVVTLEDLQTQWPTEGREWRYVDPTCTKNWEDETYDRHTGLAEGWRNIILFRITNAYVLGAEANFRLGNTTKAAQLLNVLRERAFGDPTHNFSTVSEETLIEEHARELGHEGHRWAFLKRLGKLVERTTLYNAAAAPNMQDKHVRWPLPQSFVDVTGASQNPGY